MCATGLGYLRRLWICLLQFLRKGKWNGNKVGKIFAHYTTFMN